MIEKYQTNVHYKLDCNSANQIVSYPSPTKKVAMISGCDMIGVDPIEMSVLIP